MYHFQTVSFPTRVPTAECQNCKRHIWPFWTRCHLWTPQVPCKRWCHVVCQWLSVSQPVSSTSPDQSHISVTHRYGIVRFNVPLDTSEPRHHVQLAKGKEKGVSKNFLIHTGLLIKNVPNFAMILYYSAIEFKQKEIIIFTEQYDKL